MYTLVGDVAKKYGLSQKVELRRILDVFNVNNSQQLAPEVKANLLSNMETEQRRISLTMRRLAQSIPLEREESRVNQALYILARDYFCSMFGMSYDAISPDLFKLQRAITKEVTGTDGYSYQRTNEINTEIPLFACVALGEPLWKNKREIEVDLKDRKVKYTIELQAKVPPLTQEAKRKAKEATAKFFEIYATALRTDVVGDILIKNPSRFKSNLDLEVCWIPRASELEIKVNAVVERKDPFLIGSLYGKKYLIAQWDVEGEEPYEHYIAEFKES